MKSNGLTIVAAGRLEWQPQELPELGPGEVLIEVAYSTLSPGTEKNLLLGISRPPPMYIGYSLSGHVRAVGADVAGLRIGQAVVSTARHATHVIADHRFVTAVPEGVDLEQAAFFNLAHTALYGVRQARLQIGEAVAVIGQGLVGLLTARVALLAGGLPVVAFDLDEQRLAIARAMGVHCALNARDSSALARVQRDLPGGDFPVVIEATGVRAPLEQALDLVGARGRIVLLGTTFGEETVQFHQKLSWKGAALIGAYVNSKPWSLAQTEVIMKEWPPTLAPGERRYDGAGIWSSDNDVRVILNLMRYGQLDLKPLITHRWPKEQAIEAYELVKHGDPRLVGGVIRWR